MNYSYKPAKAPDSGAIIDGAHRYRLWRSWPMLCPLSTLRACFIMLNPSTADATTDDATIRKCIMFAKQWCYAGIEILNLYSFRTSSPKLLKSARFPNGPAADGMIRLTLIEGTVGMVVYAWGAHAQTRRVKQVHAIVSELGYTPTALIVNKGGHPGHPLYLRKALNFSTLTEAQCEQIASAGKLDAIP